MSKSKAERVTEIAVALVVLVIVETLVMAAVG